MEIMPIASGSSGNAYRVTDGETPLLLDAGIPIRAIQMDITFFAAEIAIAGGVFGSAIVSYEIKAKMENVVKIKMAIIKFRLAVGNYLTPEQMAQVEIDIQALEASIDGKIDDAVAQAVNQDPEIPIY